jgi:SAM-dependent methyltransferase
MTHPIQVDARQAYLSPDWDDVVQWLSYWHQIERVLAHLPVGARLLEIGPGNGTVSAYLRARGYRVVTLDHDPALTPSVVGDVAALPFAPQTFDGVICCEVLEHVPFADALAALGELRRCVRSVCVVSLPYQSVYLSVCALPFYARVLDPLFRWLGWSPRRPVRFSLRLPLFFLRRPFTSQHHWEMGLRGYSHRRIEQAFAEAGFRVRSRGSHLLYGYHEYYVLEKNLAAPARSA